MAGWGAAAVWNPTGHGQGRGTPFRDSAGLSRQRREQQCGGIQGAATTVYAASSSHQRPPTFCLRSIPCCLQDKYLHTGRGRVDRRIFYIYMLIASVSAKACQTAALDGEYAIPTVSSIRQRIRCQTKPSTSVLRMVPQETSSSYFTSRRCFDRCTIQILPI